MPINFERIAGEARERYQAETEENRAKQDREYQERLRRTQAGIELIDSVVAPLLERAKQAFEKETIPCVITKDYDVVNYVNRLPSVKFQCVGPRRKNRHGGQSEPKSIPLFFSSDGAQVDIGLGDSWHAVYAKEIVAQVGPGEAEAPIARALEATLSSYFSEVASLRDSGLWD